MKTGERWNLAAKEGTLWAVGVSVGQIVHYVNEHGECLAALVVFVSEDDLSVNLKTFGPAGELGEVLWIKAGGRFGPNDPWPMDTWHWLEKCRS